MGVSADECMERLNAFVQPLKIQWQDPEVTAALSSFDGFRDLLGMGALSSYIQSRAMSQIPDWPNHALDEQGVALQAQVDKSLQVREAFLAQNKGLTGSSIFLFTQRKPISP